MNIKTFKVSIKLPLSIALLFLITVLAQSCAKKITFATSSVVPAAEGSVKVKKDKNNNYNIELNCNAFG